MNVSMERRRLMTFYRIPERIINQKGQISGHFEGMYIGY